MESLPHDPKNVPSGFEKELPDNSVEYLLFVTDPAADARATFSQLETLRRAALELCQTLAKEYIWQRDEFNLELKNENGLVYLHGLTEYGDAVEDEWLIVYILRQLTKTHPHVWARALDTDGEFLLVEAANVLPTWLSPEIDHNRVWIHDEKLMIIPRKDETERTISLPQAVDFIKTKPSDLVHSSFIEAEAFYRLEKYPGQVADSIHHSLVTMPRRLAYVLHTLPKSVAPAVEAFYLRDALTLKPILSSKAPLTFPPDDLVTVSVRFSKVLYAQLRSQRFETPPRWEKAFPKARPDPSDDSTPLDAATQRLEAGMKLTCGFEMLAAKAESSKSRTVRELAITIEDMKEDGDEALPSDAEIMSWPDADRNDSESWLDINYEDFERELDGKRYGAQSNKNDGFGDGQAQDNLRKIVSRFEAFLNDDTAGLDGADLDDMDFDDDDDDDSDLEEDSDAEDKEVSFNEEEFARMMREMMGLPSSVKSERPPTSAKSKGKDKATGEDDAQGDDEEEADVIKDLTSQMEAELNEYGALKLDPSSKKKPEVKDGSSSAKQSEAHVEEDDEESDGEVDVDYNLAKNILESFKSQGGMSGPTGNLLGMMGLNLPRDEDDGREDDEAGPSQKSK